jgi:hypothetical protein
MALVEDRLDKLKSRAVPEYVRQRRSKQDQRRSRHGKKEAKLTNFFISSPSVTPSFTPVRFLNIPPIRSSLKITISGTKYFIRQGLLTKRALGIRDWSLATNEAGMAGRGRVGVPQGSRGPGTKIKWDSRERFGKFRRREASWEKESRDGSESGRRGKGFELRRDQPAVHRRESGEGRYMGGGKKDEP